MSERALILVVDDDNEVRDSMRTVLEMSGYRVNDFASAEEFLAAGAKDGQCLIADIRMTGMDGLELQAELVRRNIILPLIFITGHGDVALAVRGLKAGALEFLEKPFDAEILLRAVGQALTVASRQNKARAHELRALEQLALLSPREHIVFEQMVSGQTSKAIARALGLSPRTVEIHRSHIMKKMKVKNLADLTRIACAAPAQTH